MAERVARQKSSIKRSDIARAAAARFALDGYEAATIRQIADEAGILAGSIYYHFATKEEMLHEVMQPFFDGAKVGTLATARSTDNPDLALRALIRFSLGHAMEHRAEHLILIRNPEIFRHNPAFDYARKSWEEMRVEWRQVFRAGIACGLFRADFDADIATEVVTRMISSCAGWFRPDGRVKADELVGFVCDLALSGVAGQGQMAAGPD